MEQINNVDVGLGLDGTHVLITGAAGQIGRVVVDSFISAGACVSALDINLTHINVKHERLQWFKVDVTDEHRLQEAFEQARTKFGLVSTCVAAAGLDLSFIPHHSSVCDLPLDQWKRTIDVNITGTFLTARTWLRQVRDHANHPTRNVSLIVFGSEAGVFGVPGNADYATSKAGIQYGLIRSLAPEASQLFTGARVNAIAPGPVDTPQFRKECGENKDAQYLESEATVSLRRSVPMESVAKVCLMLASENYSGSITGQTIPVDGGKAGRILWLPNGTAGW